MNPEDILEPTEVMKSLVAEMDSLDGKADADELMLAQVS